MVLQFIKKIVGKIIKEIILENINYQVLQNKLNELKINNATESAVTIGQGSRFYEQAEVHNIQNNKENIVIGNDTHIRGELLIFPHKGKIEIGNDSYIGHNTYIRSAENIKIGNGVLISHNCNIIDTNSHEIDHLERVESYKKLIIDGLPIIPPNVEAKPIIIEDYAWLSFNVSVLKGVKIGKGAIVAAGSVVTKDVEPFTLVAGNPARFIKKLPE